MAAFVDVSKALSYPGQSYPLRAEATLEEMEVLRDPVRFSNTCFEGEYLGTGKRVNLRGRVSTQVHTRCARCLEPVTYRLEAEMNVQFAGSEDPDDPDLYLFEGSKADLTDALRDAVLLEMPYRALCREDCKGLCPKCGKNLNSGPCTCQEGDDVTNPFSALKAFVHNNEEV